GRSARIHGASFPRACLATAQRIAGLPVREHLERRLPHRSAPAMAERLARGRRLRAWLQTWARRRPLRSATRERRALRARAALQPRYEGRAAAPRRALARKTREGNSPRA